MVYSKKLDNFHFCVDFFTHPGIFNKCQFFTNEYNNLTD